MCQKKLWVSFSGDGLCHLVLYFLPFSFHHLVWHWLSEAHFTGPEFWSTSGSHICLCAGEENKQQYWKHKSLSGQQTKMDQFFSLQHCYLSSLPLDGWPIFCNCQREFAQRWMFWNTKRWIEVSLLHSVHCLQNQLLLFLLVSILTSLFLTQMIVVNHW